MWYWALLLLPMAALLLPWRVGAYVAFDLLDTRAAARVRLGVLPPLTFHVSLQDGRVLWQGKPLARRRGKPTTDTMRHREAQASHGAFGHRRHAANTATPLALVERLATSLHLRAEANLLLGLNTTMVTALVCGALSRGAVGRVRWQLFPADTPQCKGYVRLAATFVPVALVVALIRR